MAEAKTSPSKPAIDSPSRYYGKFAETAIRQMEEGTAPWQRAAKAGERVLPRNAITHRAYTGGNAVFRRRTPPGFRRGVPGRAG